MDPKAVIQSQYLAALEMLRGAINQCPEPIWNDPQEQNLFWQVAYHALFYTHLYLQADRQSFVPWAKDRHQDQHRLEQKGEPYSKADLLEYLALCQEQVRQLVPALALEAPSGFDWLPMSKLELQLYNIRHLQQHVGELYERLSGLAGIEVHWVGAVPE